MAAITRSSQIVTVSGSNAKFTNAMVINQSYALISTTDCWFLIGATGATAAAATANNVYLPAGVFVEIKCNDATNGFVHVIQASAGGSACLVLLED